MFHRLYIFFGRGFPDLPLISYSPDSPYVSSPLWKIPHERPWTEPLLESVREVVPHCTLQLDCCTGWATGGLVPAFLGVSTITNPSGTCELNCCSTNKYHLTVNNLITIVVINHNYYLRCSKSHPRSTLEWLNIFKRPLAHVVRIYLSTF